MERGPEASAGGGAGGLGTDLLFAALEASLLPTVLADPNRPDEPIVLVNDAFLRLTGYDRSEVLGRNCRFLQGPGSDPDAVDRIRRAVATRTELSIEVLNYRKDGSAFRNALHLSPVFDPAGGIAYLLASQLDASRPALAGGSEDGRALRRRVRNVVHELNNMLQVIGGSVEALKAQVAASGDARAVRRADHAATAAARAAALTGELLAAADDGSPDARDPAIGDGASERMARPIDPAGMGGGERVLVVDDRPEIAELARAMLEQAGFRAEVTPDVEGAIDSLSEGFDLLFTDLVMPGALDGLGLAREAQRRHPRLRVLLTTGHTVAADAPDPGFPTIAKPYRRADLAAAVRRALHGPAADDPA